MTDITDRLHAAVPKLDDILVGWRCEVHSQLLLEAAAEIEKQRVENERLREALRFYADEIRYKPTSRHMCGHSTGRAILLDGGDRARNALEGKP